jgi:hypothetical protein
MDSPSAHPSSSWRSMPGGVLQPKATSWVAAARVGNRQTENWRPILDHEWCDSGVPFQNRHLCRPTLFSTNGKRYAATGLWTSPPIMVAPSTTNPVQLLTPGRPHCTAINFTSSGVAQAAMPSQPPLPWPLVDAIRAPFNDQYPRDPRLQLLRDLRRQRQQFEHRPVAATAPVTMDHEYADSRPQFQSAYATAAPAKAWAAPASYSYAAPPQQCEYAQQHAASASATVTADPVRFGSSVQHYDRQQQCQQRQSFRNNNDAATTMTLPPPHSSNASHQPLSLSTLSLLPPSSTSHPSSSQLSSFSSKFVPPFVSLPIYMTEITRNYIWDRAHRGLFRVVLGRLTDDHKQHAPGMKVRGHSGKAQTLPPIYFSSKRQYGLIDVDSITAAGNCVSVTHGLPRIVCIDGTILPLAPCQKTFYLKIKVSPSGQGF